ncbi:hypothetical protein [Shewanella glacialimarina]|uniref:hypothetical protein n=1 Tax=Shewanella glacialimarina TaxID=2590884 RepID=UPI001CF91CF4|nr:hypothetical protein [Shewanella glacialimarina]UCX05447.1 hypothetical protein FJ709_13705 [Shewanella glacialimarina]
MKLTPYAKRLMKYVQSVSAKGFDAQGYLDTYLPKWRDIKSAPKATKSIVIDSANDEQELK